MSWQFDSERPIYRQIIERLYADIIKGKYSQIRQFPTVRELALEAGVNPNTVQKALNEMENDGVLESRRGAGIFLSIDESGVAKVRETLLKEKTEEFIASMHELHFSNEEIEREFSQKLKGDNDE